MPRRIHLLALTLVLTLVATACGGDDDASTPTTQAAAQTATTATTPTVASSATSSLPATSTPTTAASPATSASPGVASPTTATPPERALACGDVITESVTVTNDLTCDGAAVVVEGDGVVIDLNGHTLRGPGPGTRGWPLPNFDVHGIMVRGNDVTIRNGNVLQFGLSVLVNEARNATVENVKADGSYYGIYLFHGGNHTIQGNTVTNNVYGLHLQESNGNTVLRNELSYQTHHSPGGYGLYLYSAQDNWFEFNTVRFNLNWGLWFSNSTGNTIVRNNIITNDPQVSDDSGGNVYFDAEKREGNYWDNYQGADANNDGIGDVPFGVGGPGRSADLYPFVAENGWEGRTTETQAQATPPPSPDIAPRAYIRLDDGTIAVIDPDAGELLTTWDTQLFGYPMALSPDGTRLYGVGGDAGEASNVLAIDTETGDIADAWEVPGAEVVGATYDGSRVLASSPEGLTEIVLETGELRQQHAGAGAIAITPSWKHNLVLVTDIRWDVSVVYLPDQHAAYTFRLPGPPVQAIDNRAGTRLFVVIEDSNEVLIIDTEQYAVTDRVPIDVQDSSQARIYPSPDGTTLYVLDRATSRVMAVDLGTKQVIAEVTVSGQAVALAVSSDGAYVVVPATGDTHRALILDSELNPIGTLELDAAPRAVIMAR